MGGASTIVELPIGDPILQFALLAVAVLLVQLAFRRLHIPALVGLLLVGLLAGPGGLGIVPREPVVELLGTVGLLYIMFLAGLEIDLDQVEARKLESVAFGLLAFGLTVVPAVGIGLLAGYGWAGALLIGSAVSSHTLVAYPVIERLRLVGHGPVVAAIGGTLLTDTLALVVLVVVLQQAGAGEGPFDHWLPPLAALAALVATSLLLLPRLADWFFAQESAGRAVKALAVLVVLLGLSTSADAIGTEDILGAFLAGICLNRPLQRHQELLEHVRFAGQMIFVPFFFVETGMRLEIDVLVGRGTAWMLAGLLLAAILAGKFGAAWLTGRWYGHSPVARVVVGSLALPQAAATLAVAVKAAGANLIDAPMIDAIIIVIFVTCLIGPVTTRIAGRRLAGRGGDPGWQGGRDDDVRRPGG